MSGQEKAVGEAKGTTRAFLRLPARGAADEALITSSPRAKKKGGGSILAPLAKRLNTGRKNGSSENGSDQQADTVMEDSVSRSDHGSKDYNDQSIEELASPELRRRHKSVEHQAEEDSASEDKQRETHGIASNVAQSSAIEAETAVPPRPAPDLPPAIPPPPIPQGCVREPTPEVVDGKQKGVLKSIFSPVFQLFQPGKHDSKDGQPIRIRHSMPREGSLPARSRSRSPEQWNKVAEDKAVPASAELQKGTTSSDRRTAADVPGPSEQTVKCRPAASDGASSTDGESETCLNIRSPVQAFREVKQGAESESESETGEETCAAELSRVPVNEEEDDLYEFAFDPYSFIKSLPPLENCVPAWRRALLPKQTRNCKRKTLVLDLDETLVHSTLDFGEPKTDFMFEVSLNNKKHCVNVRQRPHMSQFLKRCAELFELVIFTASQKLYAEQLLNIIDPGRKLIRHRIYRDSCLFVEGNYLKDLTLLGRDLAHTFIIDNSPQAFGFQLANGVPIESWYDDDTDNELLRMMPFLESLVDVPDVRPYIINAFKLHTLVDQAPGYA